MKIRLVNWNIRNPSLTRATRQIDWLSKTDANAVILTEVKRSAGATYIHENLTKLGFKVFHHLPPWDDYHVIVATKDLVSHIIDANFTFLPHRVVFIECLSSHGTIGIAGLYVPSRGPRTRRNENKRAFQNHVVSCLSKMNLNSIIIGGDLNVVEEQHNPHHPVFSKWEYDFYNSFLHLGLVDAFSLLHPEGGDYSWFGRKGAGYRIDHFFISSRLATSVLACSYNHEVRHLNLSDHAAMFMTIDLTQLSSKQI